MKKVLIYCVFAVLFVMTGFVTSCDGDDGEDLGNCEIKSEMVGTWIRGDIDWFDKKYTFKDDGIMIDFSDNYDEDSTPVTGKWCVSGNSLILESEEYGEFGVEKEKETQTYMSLPGVFVYGAIRKSGAGNNGKWESEYLGEWEERDESGNSCKGSGEESVTVEIDEANFIRTIHGKGEESCDNAYLYSENHDSIIKGVIHWEETSFTVDVTSSNDDYIEVGDILEGCHYFNKELLSYASSYYGEESDCNNSLYIKQ